MNEWTNEISNNWMNEQMKYRINGWMNEWTNEISDKWMNEQLKYRINE